MAPRLLFLGPVLLFAALVACGESEEVTPSVSPGDTTPTPAVSPTARPNETPTPPSDATPLPSVPADWATYQDAQYFTGAEFRYPPNWYREPGRILSLTTAEWPSVCIPPDQMLLEVSVLPEGDVSRPDGATDLKLEPYTGWELFEDATEGCPGRAHTVAIVQGEQIYTLIFVTGLDASGEDVFQKILASLMFSDWAS